MQSGPRGAHLTFAAVREATDMLDHLLANPINIILLVAAAAGIGVALSWHTGIWHRLGRAAWPWLNGTITLSWAKDATFGQRPQVGGRRSQATWSTQVSHAQLLRILRDDLPGGLPAALRAHGGMLVAVYLSDMAAGWRCLGIAGVMVHVFAPNHEPHLVSTDEIVERLESHYSLRRGARLRGDDIYTLVIEGELAS